MVLKHVPAAFLYESNQCWFPLFHGTDKNIIALSADIRAQRKDAFLTVIDYAFPFLKKYGIGKMQDSELKILFGEDYRQIKDAYVSASSLLDCCKWYEYDCFYVTADPIAATRYAKRSFIGGELGYIAYFTYLGIQHLNIGTEAATPKQINAIETVLQASRVTPAPVVYMYFGIDKSRIQKENGSEVPWDKHINLFLNDIHIGNFRILGAFDIFSGNVIDVDSILTHE